MKFTKFSLVGFITTILSISINYIGIEILTFNMYVTFSLAYFISLLLSYVLNSLITFKAGLNFTSGIIYYTVYIISFVLGLILLVFIDHIDLVNNDFYKTLLIIPVRMIISYFLVSKFVFNISK